MAYYLSINQGLVLNWYWVLSTEVLANFSSTGTGTGTAKKIFQSTGTSTVLLKKNFKVLVRVRVLSSAKISIVPSPAAKPCDRNILRLLRHMLLRKFSACTFSFSVVISSL